MNIRGILIIVGIALVAMALVYRISPLRKLVTGEAA
jgi:hypothetical protein